MINKIINANGYLEGNKLAGKLAELELPSIKFKTSETTALGIYGTVEVPVGLEKMEAKFKWNAIYADEWKKESPIKTTNIVVKSNMIATDSSGVSANIKVSATLGGLFKEIPGLPIKPGEASEGSEHLMAVSYYKLEVDGETIYEIDVVNNIFKHGDKDLLSEFNSNQ